MWLPVKRQKRVYRCHCGRWNASVLSLTPPPPVRSAPLRSTFPCIQLASERTKPLLLLWLACKHLPMVMLKPSMLKVALRPFLKRCFLELASIARQPSSSRLHLLMCFTACCQSQSVVPAALGAPVKKKKKKRKMQISDFADADCRWRTVTCYFLLQTRSWRMVYDMV